MPVEAFRLDEPERHREAGDGVGELRRSDPEIGGRIVTDPAAAERDVAAIEVDVAKQREELLVVVQRPSFDVRSSCSSACSEILERDHQPGWSACRATANDTGTRQGRLLLSPFDQHRGEG
jgi:hypothetical protein